MNGAYKGVIFDFNGTLFLDNDKHILAWSEISKMLRGKGITEEEFYRRFCIEDQEKFHLVDGAVEFFSYLKEKEIPFTIASASIKANIDFFVCEI